MRKRDTQNEKVLKDWHTIGKGGVGGKCAIKEVPNSDDKMKSFVES